MLLEIPEIFTPQQAAEMKAALLQAEWVDGRVTAGHQSAQAKQNRQLPENSPVARECGERILKALPQSGLFMSAALPQRVFPPLFNRYEGGEHFHNHVDNAIRRLPTGGQIRTDLSCTLFLSEPDEYEGGELLIDDTYGAHKVKLPAGSLVLYPSTSLHRVTPVTGGSRICSFFWLQSLVRDDGQRTLLFDLDMSINRLRQELGDHEAIVAQTGVYHNLLRRWSEP
ncbi:Fe2+-dependent dioxygenase [uncultured Microbulbifer sp.]|uniref:Fe2+-dependent dioxygenase n=1 Tax=uncultured Microbulbifer sp. TaxID=348147 RepID=UPI0025FA6D95|nr:Fe2+-dependent dioxygenase [uncultured Microbulbifer sp.]